MAASRRAVRDSSLDAFAHLHPTRLDSATFEAAFPPLPTGRYRLYAYVVHESGFARTLVATADVANGPKPAALAGASGDDAWLIGPVGAAAAESPSHSTGTTHVTDTSSSTDSHSTGGEHSAGDGAAGTTDQTDGQDR